MIKAFGPSFGVTFRGPLNKMGYRGSPGRAETVPDLVRPLAEDDDELV